MVSVGGTENFAPVSPTMWGKMTNEIGTVLAKFYGQKLPATTPTILKQSTKMTTTRVNWDKR